VLSKELKKLAKDSCACFVGTDKCCFYMELGCKLFRNEPCKYFERYVVPAKPELEAEYKNTIQAKGVKRSEMRFINVFGALVVVICNIYVSFNHSLELFCTGGFGGGLEYVAVI
jgi:hypothetical protein